MVFTQIAKFAPKVKEFYQSRKKVWLLVVVGVVLGLAFTALKGTGLNIGDILDYVGATGLAGILYEIIKKKTPEESAKAVPG